MTINPKNILLTGANGYLGSKLLPALLENGHNVSALKRKNSNLGRIENYKEKVKFYNIDKETIEQSFEQNNYDCIIHAATCYGRLGEGSLAILRGNVLFPLQLLELARKYNVKNFINVSTALPAVVNQYSLSKKQFEEWGKSFATLELIKFTNLLFEHFYGPGDAESKFTSHIFNSCSNNLAKINLTKGTQKRDFIYVDDAVSAFMTIFERVFDNNDFFQEYEIGSGVAISIKDFVELTKKLSGASTKLNFGAIPARKNEVKISKANIKKLSKLGWKPKVSLEEGIVNSILRSKN